MYFVWMAGSIFQLNENSVRRFQYEAGGKKYYKILWRERNPEGHFVFRGEWQGIRTAGKKWSKIETEKTIHYLEDYRYWNRDIGLYVQLVA